MGKPSVGQLLGQGLPDLKQLGRAEPKLFRLLVCVGRFDHHMDVRVFAVLVDSQGILESLFTKVFLGGRPSCYERVLEVAARDFGLGRKNQVHGMARRFLRLGM